MSVLLVSSRNASQEFCRAFRKDPEGPQTLPWFRGPVRLWLFPESNVAKHQVCDTTAVLGIWD